MKFEEQFPNLKGRIRNMDLGNQDGYDDFIHICDVEENCLDKQKVKLYIDEMIRVTYDEDHIKEAMERGYTREQAILLLDWALRIVKNICLTTLKERLELK